MSRKSQTEIRHRRIRKKVSGTGERPRLAVSFTGQHIYAQIIDDEQGATLVSVMTTEKDLKSDKSLRANADSATKVGKLVAERGLSKKISKVVFDRGGYKYHGKVKALAEAARAGGLEF